MSNTVVSRPDVIRYLILLSHTVPVFWEQMFEEQTKDIEQKSKLLKSSESPLMSTSSF